MLVGFSVEAKIKKVLAIQQLVSQGDRMPSDVRIETFGPFQLRSQAEDCAMGLANRPDVIGAKIVATKGSHGECSHGEFSPRVNVAEVVPVPVAECRASVSETEALKT